MQLNNSAVCTLFEGHYHYGVAALVNSLYNNGFRGDVYAGYKGALPVWAVNTKEVTTIEWKNAQTYTASNDLRLHFLPVETNRHLTNYKPAFIIQLKKIVDKGLFYFDPDIIVKCDWPFFEQWIDFGVAVCQEIVSNNFSPDHPKRMQWKGIIEKSGRKVERQLYSLFNGGFCGLNINHFEFAEIWEDIIDKNIRNSLFDAHHFSKALGKTNIFSAGDQDALNIAAMCCKSPISDIGPEGMDFTYGGWLMSHAVGTVKPWNKSFFMSSIRGFPPSLADKAYWLNAKGLIKSHSDAYINFKRFSILCSSFVGRFYKRS